ncbi:Methyltransferase-like protein 22 [Balamuthia mandrillaris]
MLSLSYAECGQKSFVFSWKKDEAGMKSETIERRLTISKLDQLSPMDAAGILDGSSDLTGLLVWPASEALAHYIFWQTTNTHEQQNKESSLFSRQPQQRVLELGAGAGLVGLVAAFHALEVVLTDGNEETLSLLEANLANNKQHIFTEDDEEDKQEGEKGEKKRNARCKLLRWGEEGLEQWRSEGETCHSFDVILGADLVYDEELLAPLFQTVNGLLARHENAFFLLMYSIRGQRLDKRVLEEAEKEGFHYELFEYPKELLLQLSAQQERKQEENEEEANNIRCILFKRKG